MSRRAKPPSLADFFHDMNKHGAASYSKVGGPFVVEIERLGGYRAAPTHQLTVWRAVDHPNREGFAPPDGKEGNRYSWDAIGRKEYTERHYAVSQVQAFGNSEARVKEFCAKNPYEGPRSTWAERNAKPDGGRSTMPTLARSHDYRLGPDGPGDPVTHD